MNNFEFELRFEVHKPEQLPAFVAPFCLLEKSHDVDIYLDNPQSLLYQRGIFIRIRNDKKLEIKFNRACLENPNLPIQDYCEEYRFDLPLQSIDLKRLNALLVSLNLLPIPEANVALLKSINNLDTHYIVDKVRTSYMYARYSIAIDEVKDLGTFLEIELLTNVIKDVDLIRGEMLCLVQPLNLTALKTGYGTLLLRQKNFQHYLLGRFVLPEDKQKVL